MALRTDYKNDELNTAVNTERQFEEVTNPNGTKSYRDVTDYSQVGDSFGADLVNSQNAEINAKAPIDSPAFTGTPTAPTQPQSTADDTIATTSYVKSTFGNFIDPNLRTFGKAADAQATGNRIASVEANIPMVDSTLTIVGAAADAKYTGDRVTNLENKVTPIEENIEEITIPESYNLLDINSVKILRQYYINSGSLVYSQSVVATLAFPITAGKTYTFTRKYKTTRLVAGCGTALWDDNSNHALLNTVNADSVGNQVTITAPTGARWLYIYFYRGASDPVYEETLEEAMIVEGSEILPYVAYGTKISVGELNLTVDVRNKLAKTDAIDELTQTVPDLVTVAEQITGASSYNLLDMDTVSISRAYIDVNVYKASTGDSFVLAFPVEAGQTYTVSRKNIESRFRSGFGTALWTDGNHSLLDATTNDSTNHFTKTAPETAEYLYVHFYRGASDTSYESATEELMITLGDQVLPYRPYAKNTDVSIKESNLEYSLAEKITDSNFVTEQITAPSYNLLDIENANVCNAYIDGSRIVSSVSAKTLVLPIEGGKTYTVSRKNVCSRFAIGYSDTLWTSETITLLSNLHDNSATVLTLKAPDEAAYLYIYVYRSASDSSYADTIEEAMVVEGEDVLPYIAYGETMMNIDEEDLSRDLLKKISMDGGEIKITPEITWWNHMGIVASGDQINVSSDDYYMSNPIPVRKGDVVMFHGYPIAQTVPIAYSYEKQNTYGEYGIPTYDPAVPVASATGWGDFECTIDHDGYIVVFSRTQNIDASLIKLTITRKASQQKIADAVEAVRNDFYDVQKNYYVKENDFVPNLAKKRQNGIVIYEADDKHTGTSYIVNAVSYPDGTIIACRKFDVVRINPDGTESDPLLHIWGSHDWRLCFMDTNQNVYVSPHTGVFSPGPVLNTNRGLYRLTPRANSFTKVVPLCSTDYGNLIPLWTANTSYNVGDIVFVYLYSIFYRCKTAHTSGTSFDATKWEEMDEWASNTSYAVGDIVKSGFYYFRCKVAHTSGTTFDESKWIPATACMDSDDTIWNMCEDAEGNLYAGVYAHSTRPNPAVYKSTDGGATWTYSYNFIMSGVMPYNSYGYKPMHVHCIAYNEYNKSLYAAVGGGNTIFKSSDNGETWEDLHVRSYYGQPTALIGVPDGLLMGSDGHYSCGVTKLMSDDKTVKACGRTTPGFVFAFRRSDVTGWIYAFTRTDYVVEYSDRCPPLEAMTDPSALETWLTTYQRTIWTRMWTDYNKWAEKYYPEDAIRPVHAVIMVSKDNGDTWEVVRYEKVNYGYGSMCGYITIGHFRDGEVLTGRAMQTGTGSGQSFVKPLVISEGKKKRTSSGYDLSDEIFIKTNTSTTVDYE